MGWEKVFFVNKKIVIVMATGSQIPSIINERYEKTQRFLRRKKEIQLMADNKYTSYFMQSRNVME